MSIQDFTILSKLGTLVKTLLFLGEGAFSMVYKVKRNSDGKVYALKKVRVALDSPLLAGEDAQALGQGTQERTQRGAHPRLHRVCARTAQLTRSLVTRT